MDKQIVSFTLNGEAVKVGCDPSSSLLSLLRDKLGLLGTKVGCGRGECGACTILLDGLAVNACLVPAGKAEGLNVETIESLSRGGRLHPIQEAFVENGAVQCGFCTPGMVMSAHALLKREPAPGREEIRKAISGNLCRCSGYKQIEEAIERAAKRLKD